MTYKEFYEFVTSVLLDIADGDYQEVESGLVQIDDARIRVEKTPEQARQAPR